MINKQEAAEHALEDANDLGHLCMEYLIGTLGCPEKLALEIATAGRAAMLEKMLEISGQ